VDLFISNHRQGANNFLFRNNGDGTFTKVAEGPVVNDGGGSTLCAWADYDNDGYLDLFVVNGFHEPEPSFLYRNNGGPNHWNQNDLRAHFGLGDAESAETVLIEWPSGVTQVLKNIAANQHLVVEEDPIPSVAFSFSEGGGFKTRNFGSLADSGQITTSDEWTRIEFALTTANWRSPGRDAGR
jgi:hypothetical protein